MISPEYLGGGVYAQPSPELREAMMLTTGSHNESHADNVIIMEPEVISALVTYIERFRKDIADNYDPTP